MLKRIRAFMHRNSSWVTFSMQNLWESSLMLTQCSYIEETFIRLLQEGRRRAGRREGEQQPKKRQDGLRGGRRRSTFFFFYNTAGEMRRQEWVKARRNTRKVGGN